MARWNSLQQCSTRRLSKSSPPRRLSPAVARTSSTPCSMTTSDASHEPPEREKTRTVCSPAAWAPESSLESRQKATAAAVGALRMRRTLRPAMSAASRVARRCASEKCAGTVMTALVTFCPKRFSAWPRILPRTSAASCSGLKSRWAPFHSTWTRGRPCGSGDTANGQSSASATMSWYEAPRRRRRSNRVFFGFLVICVASAAWDGESAVSKTAGRRRGAVQRIDDSKISSWNEAAARVARAMRRERAEMMVQNWMPLPRATGGWENARIIEPARLRLGGVPDEDPAVFGERHESRGEVRALLVLQHLYPASAWRSSAHEDAQQEGACCSALGAAHATRVLTACHSGSEHDRCLCASIPALVIIPDTAAYVGVAEVCVGAQARQHACVGTHCADKASSTAVAPRG